MAKRRFAKKNRGTTPQELARLWEVAVEGGPDAEEADLLLEAALRSLLDTDRLDRDLLTAILDHLPIDEHHPFLQDCEELAASDHGRFSGASGEDALLQLFLIPVHGEISEVEAAVLGGLASAIRDAERIRFSYTAVGGSTPGEVVRRHVEPHQLVTVGRRWYLLAYDLDRGDWRSFRLDRLTDPEGTRSMFRRREIPGGDAAAYVRSGLSRREAGHALVAVVAAPAGVVEAKIGRWVEVADLGPGRCRVSGEAPQPWYWLQALGILEADFTIEDAGAEVRHMLASWGSRFVAAG